MVRYANNYHIFYTYKYAKSVEIVGDYEWSKLLVTS